MSKITAVLEQETWVAVDAPDEFQAIVDSFTSSETFGNGRSSVEDTSLIRADSGDQGSKTAEADVEETSAPDDGTSQFNGTVSLPPP